MLHLLSNETLHPHDHESHVGFHRPVDTKSRTALVLGGGAPNSALMAGALAAFQEEGISFDVVSTSGAGGLMGLLWLAPKNATPDEALRNWLNSYVHDAIYDQFPVAYKVFTKPGAAADNYRSTVTPFLQSMMGGAGNSVQRFWNDWTQLLSASFCPSTPSSKDTGLCARLPWVEEIVDFDKIKDLDSHFYINAYNIDQKKMENFSRDEITLDHFKAAFAFPFIYGPYQMGEDNYYEGASHECLNFRGLYENHPNLDTIVVLDVMGSESLIRQPRDLYDSWVQSIIVPLVQVAKNNLELFTLKDNRGWHRTKGARADLMVMPWIGLIPTVRSCSTSGTDQRRSSSRVKVRSSRQIAKSKAWLCPPDVSLWPICMKQ